MCNFLRPREQILIIRCFDFSRFIAYRYIAKAMNLGKSKCLIIWNRWSNLFLHHLTYSGPWYMSSLGHVSFWLFTSVKVCVIFFLGWKMMVTVGWCCVKVRVTFFWGRKRMVTVGWCLMHMAYMCIWSIGINPSMLLDDWALCFLRPRSPLLKISQNLLFMAEKHCLLNYKFLQIPLNFFQWTGP